VISDVNVISCSFSKNGFESVRYKMLLLLLLLCTILIEVTVYLIKVG